MSLDPEPEAPAPDTERLLKASANIAVSADPIIGSSLWRITLILGAGKDRGMTNFYAEGEAQARMLVLLIRAGFDVIMEAQGAQKTVDTGLIIPGGS